MIEKIVIVGILILGFFAVLYSALSSTIYTEEAHFVESIYKKARDDYNFQPFISYQNQKYILLNKFEDDSYYIETYQLYNVLDDNTIQTDLLIILTNKSEVVFATNKNDSNDNMSFIIKNDHNTIYDSKTNEETKNFPMSLGLSPGQIGFVYVVLPIDILDYEIQVTDYEGTLIVNQNINLYNLDLIDSFNDGYTLSEINQMMDLDNKIQQQSIIFTSIYIGLIGLIFGSIYVIKKVKKRNAN